MVSPELLAEVLALDADGQQEVMSALLQVGSDAEVEPSASEIALVRERWAHHLADPDDIYSEAEVLAVFDAILA
jgi:hypothetical protein